MKLNLKRPLIVFDLETTGLDLVGDRIIQLSYIKIFPDGKEEREDLLVNPSKSIPLEVTILTGITNEQVANAPTFVEVANHLAHVFNGCDFAGFNSNHFDIPMLAEEFLRAGVDFDFSKARLVDAQVIFHKMEKRNLAAAYKFYCGRKMEDDFEAHRADQDAEATYRVLLGELERYSPDNEEEPERQLPNDIDYLATFSRMNDNVDFAGRIVWMPVLDKDGKPLLNDKKEVVKHECFNFGKYRGVPVLEVLQKDPGYYSWMMASEFTNHTKQVLTRIRLKTFNT